MRTSTLAAALCLLAALPALAQQSARFKAAEHVFDAGGNPANGVTLQSARFRVSLDGLGDALCEVGLASPGGFRADAGFLKGYLPPGEVQGLRFMQADTLAWDAERTAGTYHLYRGFLTAITDLDYGSCEATDLTATSVQDTDVPPAAEGYYYLATVRNRLDEEGTKGFRTGGTEREGSRCP